MNIFVAGLNHKTAPVQVREKLAFNDQNLPAALVELRSRIQGLEIAIISTCNRVEIYAAATGTEKLSEDIIRFLSDFHDIEPESFAPHLYHYYDYDAVRHLFTVSSSLDSLVLGESEILGQVKNAYTFALQERVTGKVLNNLFQNAFGVAKKVRTSSSIGRQKVSVASVAVEFAQKIFSDFSDKTVMIIGAGEMGELTLKHMVEKGISAVMVANRTYQKAVDLASEYNGIAIRYESFMDNMHQADVVICTSGAPHHIIFPKQMPQVLRARRNKPVFLIDIAVPRDIHPDLEKVENIYLYNIDDLQKIVNENIALREKELEHCSKIIEVETERFMAWLGTLDVGDIIREFREELHRIRKTELLRSLNKLPEMSDVHKQEIEYLTERIVNKILNNPTQVLKREASKEAGYRYIDALKNLFGLN